MLAKFKPLDRRLSAVESQLAFQKDSISAIRSAGGVSPTIIPVVTVESQVGCSEQAGIVNEDEGLD